MQENDEPRGSAARWGPLFSAGARDWAETWEGALGWGTPMYEHLLRRAEIGPGTRVLDCGCGAGRFARMAADRGAVVAGIDAAQALIDIAAERIPEGDFRVGDFESLPWREGSFDVVTGLSSFQFADDKVRVLAEARRVATRYVAIVIPSRVGESGIAAVFKPLFPLFPPEALLSMKESGMFALSEPGKLEAVLAAAGLETLHDDEVDCAIGFAHADVAVRAFVSGGPTALAIERSGKRAVTDAVREALRSFTDPEDRVVLPAWYRAVVAQA